MSERDDALELLDKAAENLKSHEDHVRLGKSLGLSTTISVSADCGISMLTLAREHIEQMRKRITQPERRYSLPKIGAACFLAGYVWRSLIGWFLS